ncbi:family 48 glycosyltransferase [Jimgerdemannia flammicorona]|uniref:1,3-beta-glucan synthase n=1 Tax=Jimgerdemannia flammicorona TaxID=994334 RepID=A0A433Q852_9FUNG|nr:family 48 glycosyltransferase [Jimgerdemannia flammicorona]
MEVRHAKLFSHLSLIELRAAAKFANNNNLFITAQLSFVATIAILFPLSTNTAFPSTKGKTREHSDNSETESESFSGSNFTSRSDIVPTPNSGVSAAADVDLLVGLRGLDEGRYMNYAPSADSLLTLLDTRKHPQRPPSNYFLAEYHDKSGASTPPPRDLTLGQNGGMRPSDPWPSWCADQPLPVSREQLEDIFVELSNRFGFQRDSTRNMYEHMMTMLDSRASRMTQTQALVTLHADYIGGEHANYRKWYFAAQLDLDDAVGDRNVASRGGSGGVVSAGGPSRSPRAEDVSTEPESTDNLEKAEARWQRRMHTMSQYEKARQVALYLLIWGESATVRFTPECLCFIFKLANDYYVSGEWQTPGRAPVREGTFLADVVTPIYRFLRDEQYEMIGDKFVKRERDHSQIIGYDDVNQLFWYPETIDRIVLKDDKTKLHDLPAHRRYLALKDVAWELTFQKTYKERRTWLHLAVNFTRIWIIHVVAFYYYTSYNAPFLYLNADPDIAATETAVQWSIVGLGGALASVFMLAGAGAEYFFVPLTWRNTDVLIRRMTFLVLIFAINVAPSIYVVIINRTSTISRIIGIVQFFVGIATTLIFALVPSSRLFASSSPTNRKTLASQTFTASFPKLRSSDRAMSIGLWLCVFGCKFIESYFFLTLSFKDPLKVMNSMRVLNCRDRLVGSMLCTYMPIITLILMFFMDLVLFFLDTYLWYIIWNTVFSVARSFHLGISIWTPWRNIFSRLPKRIYAKILATTGMEVKYKPKVLCSQIWNSIVISMYREHLLSVDHLQRLLYQQVPSEEEGKKTIKPPTFFVSKEDTNFKTEFYPQHSEAERRISFFAQSLSTPMPEPLPVENMPTFTVLVPHYSEKILLSLREIIREEDQNTRVTLLEYLKQLHPVEWDNFVKDTKILSEESSMFTGVSNGFSFGGGGSNNSGDPMSEKEIDKSKIDDLPFYCIGFKSSAPEYTLRTRIWASLRAQTLYRTVSGFMNYQKAIKLLYRVESPELVQQYLNHVDRLEVELEQMARRKFRFVVSMQRYHKFNREERENAEFLLRAYPDLQIAYMDEEPSATEGEEPVMYSALIDGHCEVMPDGRRKPRFRIRLPGNPILGDGKADNQNHALIFYRGEYLQLIDANQDNYLEECLKIRNILGEFEETAPPPTSPYSPSAEKSNIPPVAIVGAREYIFSENIGVLGDVAAGKEQTFGTLSQRIMAKIGGKLHYGHPDFLNGIFMTTRGGVSKAQKGLHLNEDIYAGICAFTRGGRIKHTEYYQCGKGRDLGFGSILNFTTKIGTGMGEQMLSREYYYLGTQLPLDRFLTFYYAHPGFHINNIFIMLSVHLFMFALLFLGSMASTLTICKFNPDAPPDSPLSPAGCYNLVPVYEWIKRCVLSIFLVFFIAFLPLCLQELTEKGFLRSITRLGKHFLSLSPLFEVFVTQIYTNSILTNLSFGGARYISTGRGFATARIPFSILYSRFAGPSIYVGFRTGIILLFVSLVIRLPHLIYFWITVIALCLSPFIFNPHQFGLVDFIVDYREYLRWLSRGNSLPHSNSWIAYCRLSRTRITGYKRKKLGDPSDNLASDVPRADVTVIFFSEIVMPLLHAVLCIIAFLFVRSFNPQDYNLPNTGPSALLRLAIISIGPILLNSAALIGFFITSMILGPILSSCCNKFGGVMAAMAHAWAVINLLALFELLWFLEMWSFSNAILGMIAVGAIQRFIFKLLIVVFLTREFKHDETNRAWWTGKWYGRGLGWHVVSQPLREFICKVVEMSMFATDFVLGHILLIALAPICLIPYIDQWHSIILFWLRPSKQIRGPIFSMRQRTERNRIAVMYGFLFLLMTIIFVALIIAPLMVGKMIPLKPSKLPL